MMYDGISTWEGTYVASQAITNICLYYFFNMTCLCEPMTIVSVRIGEAFMLFVYMKHVVEGHWKLSKNVAQDKGPRQVVYVNASWTISIYLCSDL